MLHNFFLDWRIMKKVIYTDETILVRGKVHYLRTKYAKRGGLCVMSIRTQRNGKGKKIIERKGVITSAYSKIELMVKIHTRVKFQVVRLVSVNEMMEQIKKENQK